MDQRIDRKRFGGAATGMTCSFLGPGTKEEFEGTCKIGKKTRKLSL